MDYLCSLLNPIAHGQDVDFFPSSEKDAHADVKEMALCNLAKKRV
jgi:hypothetical protein